MAVCESRPSDFDEWVPKSDAGISGEYASAAIASGAETVVEAEVKFMVELRPAVVTEGRLGVVVE